MHGVKRMAFSLWMNSHARSGGIIERLRSSLPAWTNITHDNVERFSLTGADSSSGIAAEKAMHRAGKRKTLYVIMRKMS